MCKHPMEALHLTSTQRMYAQKNVLVTKKLKKEGGMSCPDILLILPKHNLKCKPSYQMYEIHGLSFSGHLCSQSNSKPNIAVTS